MDSNHRFLHVTQGSWPLDHGTISQHPDQESNPESPRSKRGVMSVSPSGQRRKARESNPPLREEITLAGWPGQPISGCLPYRVDPLGIEPRSPPRQGGVFPLDHGPVVSGPPGNRTPISALRRRRLPVGRAARCSGDVGNRTRHKLFARQPRAPATFAPIIQRSARESNPAHFLTTEGCCPNTCRPSSDPGWTRTIVFLRVKQAS